MGENIFEHIVDYCSGNISEADSRTLQSWINTAPENRETFEKYLRLVKMHRMVKGSEEIRDAEAWKRLSATMAAKKIRRIRQRVVAVAAVVLLFLGIGLGFLESREETVPLGSNIHILPGTTKATLVLANGTQLDLTRNDLREVQEQGALIKNDTTVGLQYELNHQKMEEPVWHTVKVPVSGEYHFTLSDGTRVWLNSESEITFPVSFVGGSREVVVKGEAYFEVKSDKAHPFIVHAKEVDIEVVGTKFNVAAYEDSHRVVTTLAEGRVNVEMSGQVVGLSPDEQVSVDLKSGKMAKNSVSASTNISWIQGIFEYENMTLEEITTQLSRWYGVDFIFSAAEFKTRRFTGVVKKYDELNNVLKIIEKTTNVSFMINGKDIAVKSTVY
ncbi:MAG: DUF4974 domain-containing protein [Odoribacter sp.]|nr:DUF4974 domain-containing protein [Odoribacter sp.]